MTKEIIFEDSFLLSGIMCYEGCGVSIQSGIQDFINECKAQKTLPQDADLNLNAEPEGLGIHRIYITISQQKNNTFSLNKGVFSAQLTTRLNEIMEVVRKALDTSAEKSFFHSNWFNICINLLSFATITLLSLTFPPSILLTVSLTSLSFLTTAYTAQVHLNNFFQNLRKKDFANMATTVTMGWVLSLIHALYHAITMPLTSNFAMIFMCFLMPILLISIINGIDELHNTILNKAQKMNIHGMSMLFPNMSAEYSCYALSEEQDTFLAAMDIESPQLWSDEINQILNQQPSLIMRKKNLLKKGMLIKINRGECVPVDCILIGDSTEVNAALLTGEPQQTKCHLDIIPAGAINLSRTITVYTTKDSYNSNANKLLFVSNRAPTRINHAHGKNQQAKKLAFTYVYSALIILGLLASLIVPLYLGILTVPLLLQNITGILFAVCPCTIAIAHELPTLLNAHYLSKKGINMRNTDLCKRTDTIQTVVFDKTGTLTTGKSIVESFEGISSELWYRIYLLEKEYGAEHPVAKALIACYEAQKPQSSIINDIQDAMIDPQHRGLCAKVQGRKIHIGNAEYMDKVGHIKTTAPDSHKLALGYTVIYVAEDEKCLGTIYIKHEARKDITKKLKLLSEKNIRLIMLTGDTPAAANIFNQQNGTHFKPENIKAGQTPDAKGDFLDALMNEKDTQPETVWFIGDGLNDAHCAKRVTEHGGISCAITAEDKASFFTNISLNGSLEYLFAHEQLNLFLQKNIIHNQGILLFGAMAFTAFIISFSIAGIAVSPLIPLFVMMSTTLFVLFNSYRVPLKVDVQINPERASWFKRMLASDLSISSLVAANTLLIAALLISTIATGGLALPVISFSSGVSAIISSLCLLGSGGLFSAFILVATGYYCAHQSPPPSTEDEMAERHNPVPNNMQHDEKKGASYPSLWRTADTPQEEIRGKQLSMQSPV